MSTNYKFYINGEWRESQTKEVIDIVSPYNDTVVGRVQAISQGEADEAIQAAKLEQ